MSTKKKIPLILASITLILITLYGFQKKEKAMVKPNILFISIDDLRPNLGVYGA